MKGIILSGGYGTRFYPVTQAISKQLVPVYDKPMIYYPLSILMLANIKDILVIGQPQQLPLFEQLLGSGNQWGLNFLYAEQRKPNGLPEAFLIAKEFIGNEPVCMILGDNIFYGHDLTNILLKAANTNAGAHIFAYEVNNPEKYGVIEFDSEERVISLEEKPKFPKSNYVMPGLYFYDNLVVDYASSLKPSKRGELEIIDLNEIYLKKGELVVEVMRRGIAWLDAGQPNDLLHAANFVQAIQERQGLMIACIEEIAYRRGFISLEQLQVLVAKMGPNHYREYLQRLISKTLQ